MTPLIDFSDASESDERTLEEVLLELALIQAESAQVAAMTCDLALRFNSALRRWQELTNDVAKGGH
jgi:hypothetical protein